MSSTQVLEVQQGIWIDEQWLQSAGLGSRLQVIVQSGEIRIVSAQTKSVSQPPSAKAWSVFRSFGKNARVGKLQNSSRHHRSRMDH